MYLEIQKSPFCYQKQLLRIEGNQMTVRGKVTILSHISPGNLTLGNTHYPHIQKDYKFFISTPLPQQTEF